MKTTEREEMECTAVTPKEGCLITLALTAMAAIFIGGIIFCIKHLP